MGKWNKATSQPPSEQFLQNQERRRQLIVEAARRRRQKQKKLQELNQQIKRKQQQALNRHKEEKKQSYQRHFKAAIPSTNMHDKYEKVRKNQKMQKAPDTEVSKWKRKGKSEQKNASQNSKNCQNYEKTKIQGKTDSFKQRQPQNIKPANKQKQKIIDQFANEWQDEQEEIIQDLIGSKLLDSLDLDIDTLTRGQQYDQKLKKNNQTYEQKIKKQQKKEIQEMKALIGYDSMLLSIDQRDKKQKIQKDLNHGKKKIAKPNKQQLNQQETFNELKNKKQAKLLGWTNLATVEEADDLFSHCSSHKTSSKVIKGPSDKNGTQKSINSRKVLEPIPERKLSANKPRQSIKNNERSISIEKKSNNDKRSNIEKKSVEKQKTPQVRQRENSREKVSANLIKVRQNKARQKSREKTKSIQKEKNVNCINAKGSKTHYNSKQRNIPPPHKPTPSVQYIKNPAMESVVTHEQFFDVESFIKNDLVNINKEEQQLQNQIRELHINNKQKLKQIENKHQIRVDYKTADNLIKHHEDTNYQSQVYLYSKNAPRTEDQLEDSIQKLDDLLIKKQLASLKTENNILEESSNSIINPFSRPEDFQKQILQLAENISRFEEQPDPKGYGYGQMKKKKKIKNEIPEEITSESKHIEDQSVGYRAKITKNKPQHPPVLQYCEKSGKNSAINEGYQQNGHQDKFEDSLDTMGRIQVNEKLKNILFD